MSALLCEIERQTRLISELAHDKLDRGTDIEKEKAVLELHDKLTEIKNEIEEEI